MARPDAPDARPDGVGGAARQRVRPGAPRRAMLATRAAAVVCASGTLWFFSNHAVA